MLDEQRDRRAGLRCPTCARPVPWAANPSRPCSSLTCKLIDLGRWRDETCRAPGEPRPLEVEPETDATRGGA